MACTYQIDGYGNDLCLFVWQNGKNIQIRVRKNRFYQYAQQIETFQISDANSNRMCATFSQCKIIELLRLKGKRETLNDVIGRKNTIHYTKWILFSREAFLCETCILHTKHIRLLWVVYKRTHQFNSIGLDSSKK